MPGVLYGCMFETPFALQWLDTLERTDPEAYEQLIATMRSQLENAGTAAAGTNQSDADSALFDMLKATASGTAEKAGTGNGTEGRAR